MENLECPHCGSPLGKGVAVCGECGKEVSRSGKPNQTPQEERQSGKNIYAVLAVFLVVVGGCGPADVYRSSAQSPEGRLNRSHRQRRKDNHGGIGPEI